MTTFDQYRFDIRTKEQAMRDIKMGTKRQNLVVKAFIKYWEKVFGETPKVEDNGCDNTGEFLEQDKVSADADIKLNGHLLEIKTIHGYPKELWLKKDHIDRLIKDGAHVLLCIGDFTNRKDIYFTTIFNDQLKEIVKDCDIDYPEKYGMMKAVYVVYPNQFVWGKLPC